MPETRRDPGLRAVSSSLARIFTWHGWQPVVELDVAEKGRQHDPVRQPPGKVRKTVGQVLYFIGG